MVLTCLRANMTSIVRLTILAGLYLFTSSVYAQNVDLSGVTAQSILVNIADAIPNLMRMVTAIAYVMGILMIIRGVMVLKHAGESRTMMSREHSMMVPITLIAVGTLLLYLPTSVQVGMSSFWNEPNPYGYEADQSAWAQFINVCFLVVQFIGTIAFIRGLIILSHAGGGHGGQGQVGRGITHIIGGILCINIYQFLQVVFSLLGVAQ